MRLRPIILLLLLAAAGCSPEFTGAPPTNTVHPQARSRASTERFVVSVREIKVLDGDTISHKGVTVRLMGYDTPEKANPERFNGSQEPWASRAEDKLRDLVAGAARVEIAYCGEPDKYGRRLAHLYADGVTVGVALVKAGLAYANVDHFGAQGFDEEARQLRAAAAASPKPEFEEPYRWRAKNALKTTKHE